MKLYRLSVIEESDLLNANSEELRLALLYEAVDKINSVLVSIFRANNVEIFYQSIYRSEPVYEEGKVPGPSLGKLMKVTDIKDVIRVNLLDEAYCKIRDFGGRFVDFGYDTDVHVCLHHEDELPPTKSLPTGLEITDVSDLLVSSDQFDQ